MSRFGGNGPGRRRWTLQTRRRRMGRGNRHWARHARLRPADGTSVRRRHDTPSRWPLSSRGRLDRNGQWIGDFAPPGRRDGHRFEAKRKAYLSPRTTAFNVQGVRLAVHRITGETRILQSVHAADIGRLINPVQCRGQIDGAIAMGIGWALTEHMDYDANGHMQNAALRNYRI